MSMEIEVPIGGVITVCGTEVVCVEDYHDKNCKLVGCNSCPLKDTLTCTHFNCGQFRTDSKNVHLEYYYGVKK